MFLKACQFHFFFFLQPHKTANASVTICLNLSRYLRSCSPSIPSPSASVALSSLQRDSLHWLPSQSFPHLSSHQRSFAQLSFYSVLLLICCKTLMGFEWSILSLIWHTDRLAKVDWRARSTVFQSRVLPFVFILQGICPAVGDRSGGFCRLLARHVFTVGHSFQRQRGVVLSAAYAVTDLNRVHL